MINLDFFYIYLKNQYLLKRKMMKKLLFLGSALFACVFGLRAQTNVIVMDTLVTDTLHYYLNKHFFKSAVTTSLGPATSLANFPYYKSAAATVTNVSHCGSKFENCGDTVQILGLTAYAAKHITTASLNIKVHLYLCNLNAAGKPILPPIDSVVTAVGGGSVLTPSLIGGYFGTSPNYRTHTLNGSFAVLFRNMSTISGDTVHLLRTAGKTATNTTAAAKDKCSDGFGFVRNNGVFYSATNYTALGFGVGTDYEFCVAPIVRYHLVSSFTLPEIIANPLEVTSPGDTSCTRIPYTFTNTSSCRYMNRMYNLNAFYPKWALGSSFINQPLAGGFSADSAITWYFEFLDIALPPRDSRVFLPYGNTSQTITTSTDLVQQGCFTSNQFRARFRPMSAMGRMPQLIANHEFSVCTKFCWDDAVGIQSVGNYAHLNFYPNPVVNGQTTITGLTGRNTILVYDVLGQLVTTKVSEDASAIIDLSKEANGTYVVKISNTNNQIKVAKLLKQN